MSLLGTDCVNCKNKDNCSLLLGFRTAWCKVESLIENLTKQFYCGTINMKCENYIDKDDIGDYGL